ncbi:hypothetical protein TNCV_3653701 [Trichonephila clavipes]|nr:hypothetical protein TNCV_3653701 [Trichonephila clavipes]
MCHGSDISEVAYLDLWKHNSHFELLYDPNDLYTYLHFNGNNYSPDLLLVMLDLRPRELYLMILAQDINKSSQTSPFMFWGKALSLQKHGRILKRLTGMNAELRQSLL